MEVKLSTIKYLLTSIFDNSVKTKYQTDTHTRTRTHTQKYLLS